MDFLDTAGDDQVIAIAIGLLAIPASTVTFGGRHCRPPSRPHSLMMSYLQEQGIIGFILGCSGREENRTPAAGRRQCWPPMAPSSGWVGEKKKIPHSGPRVREFKGRMRGKAGGYLC